MPVTVTVEDGSNVASANSYQTMADWKLYADAHGYSYAGKSDDQIGSALIRATTWLDATYRSRWPGVRTYGSAQYLLWPRKAGSIQYGEFVADAYLTTVTDSEGLAIAIDEIPAALISAHAEATWRELVEPGSLSPDLERGGALKSFKAVSVALEYFGTAPAGTTFSKIDGLLAGLLIGDASGGGYTARAVRA